MWRLKIIEGMGQSGLISNVTKSLGLRLNTNPFFDSNVSFKFMKLKKREHSCLQNFPEQRQFVDNIVSEFTFFFFFSSDIMLTQSACYLMNWKILSKRKK